MLLNNKFLLLLGFFFFSLQSYSQKDILDYIVKDKDTFYGAIRTNGTQNRLWFYHRVTGEDGKSFIKEEKISKKKIRTFRRNGKIFHYREGEYQTLVRVIPDYIVTKENDTVYGEIKTSFFMQKRFLLDKKGEKHPIKSDVVSAYSVDNKVYKLINGSFSRLILEGPVSLYYFIQGNTGTGLEMSFNADLSGVYIHKGEEFQRVFNSGFYPVTEALFGDNLELMKRIEEREFTIDNIYLVTQIYNRYLEEKKASL